MNPTRGMQTRLQQQQQQQQEARERTHEPICVKETRICWIEFGASLTCLVLGLIFVFAGVSADSSAVGSSGGSQAAKPAGILALTYLGVVLLIIGAALLILFGIHFHRVKTRLDAVKAERFAQLGIQPSSRYQQLPTRPATAANFGGPPRPPPLPLPSREQQQPQQQQHQQQQQQQQQQQVPPQQRPQQPQMSSSRLQPMPSYREGAFYNLGFLGDEAEARPPMQPTVATISTGRAPSQQQPPGSLLGRNAPVQSQTGATVGPIISKPNSFVGSAVESTKRGPSADYGAPLPDEHKRHGPIGQYTAPPPADQNRRHLSTRHNPPPPTDHTRSGPTGHNVAQPPADHTRRGLSTQYNASVSADQTRHGPSTEYGTQKIDDYPRRNPYVQHNASIPANYTKQGLPSSFEKAPQRAVHEKRAARFATPAAENFSSGFMDAPPAGAVGGVQASRSYHSGFSGGATGQKMSASASGQDFQAKAAIGESGRQGFKSERPYGESPYLPSWQRPPVETPPPQRSPPPGYALDPLSLMRQPLREGHQIEHQRHQQPSHQQQQRQQQSAVSQPRKHPSGYRSSQI